METPKILKTMKYTIAVIPGDGIGPEVTAQAKKALNAIADVYNHTFIYKEAQMGACAIDATGNPLPDETIKICKNLMPFYLVPLAIRSTIMIHLQP